MKPAKNNRVRKSRSIKRVQYKNASAAYMFAYGTALNQLRFFDFGDDDSAELIIDHKIKSGLNYKNYTHIGASWKHSEVSSMIYIEQNKCTIRDLSSKKDINKLVAPQELICFGGKNYTIETNTNQAIGYLSVTVDSKVDNYTLKFIENCGFVGTITQENAIIEVSEDSVLLSNGVLLSESFFNKLCKDLPSVTQAEKYLKSARFEWKEINQKILSIEGVNELTEWDSNLSKVMNWRNDGHPVSSIFNEWEKQLKKIKSELIAMDYSHLREKVIRDEKIRESTTALEAFTFTKDYQFVIDEFRNYQLDLVKMMQYPILSDFSDIKVKSFNLLCMKIEGLEETIPLSDFKNEWLSLVNYAKIQSLSRLDDVQFKKFTDSKTMLAKALNEESTDNEKELSIKALERNLNGILPVDSQVINLFKQKVGLIEIEK